MPGWEQQYIVCGVHQVRHPASSRCPHCPERNPRGVREQPVENVDVVYDRGDA